VAGILLNEVGKVYGDGTEAVRSVNLEIEDAELAVLVGPSGCGKTTILRMIAGLEEITSGTIAVGAEVVNEVDPRDRDLAMVFQNYALYPHMTVAENIAFPLRLAGVSKRERLERARAVARTLGLESHFNRKPRHLSGGQRQRVAMGRAIIRQPQAFLMDEPLSNLDAKLRVQMRAEISSLQRALHITTVYVTHDQIEAMTMGDKVAVMRQGELQQFGSPEEVYGAPANVFVAGFIGSPPMNLVQGQLQHAADGYAVEIGSTRVRLEPEEIALTPELSRFAGRSVIVGIRPERLEDAALASQIPADRRIRGTVSIREALGSDVLIHFRLTGSNSQLSSEIYSLIHDVEDPAQVEELNVAGEGAVFVGRFSPNSNVGEGDNVEIAILPRALQFFEPEHGFAISGGQVTASGSRGVEMGTTTEMVPEIRAEV
jgi:multiple sugar transport system ATP-binding protein